MVAQAEPNKSFSIPNIVLSLFHPFITFMKFLFMRRMLIVLVSVKLFILIAVDWIYPQHLMLSDQLHRTYSLVWKSSIFKLEKLKKKRDETNTNIIIRRSIHV